MANRQTNTMGRHTDEQYGRTDRRTLWTDRQTNTMDRWMKDRHRQNTMGKQTEGETDRTLWASRQKHMGRQTEKNTGQHRQIEDCRQTNRRKGKQNTTVKQTEGQTEDCCQTDKRRLRSGPLKDRQTYTMCRLTGEYYGHTD